MAVTVTYISNDYNDERQINDNVSWLDIQWQNDYSNVCISWRANAFVSTIVFFFLFLYHTCYALYRYINFQLCTGYKWGYLQCPVIEDYNCYAVPLKLDNSFHKKTLLVADFLILISFCFIGSIYIFIFAETLQYIHQEREKECQNIYSL